ncbi:uncharacterized protein [Engystomops pustulosus]|uniref:uncharacterized protein n=1 Tax=Engystomops pustulosus TaxID=76066 RepID=UPI003AFAD124
MFLSGNKRRAEVTQLAAENFRDRMENNPVPDQTFYSGMTEKILNLSLEIIYLLTGEDNTVVRNILDKSVTPISCPHVSGGWSKSPIMEPPSLMPKRNKKQKILEITYKMIELLSGEEEWDYIEGHKDQYKNIIMEEHQDPPSPDGSSERNPSERCPSPWYSQDGPEEDYSVPDGEQAEDVADIKVEVLEEEKEGDLIDDLQCKEEASPVEISPGFYSAGNLSYESGENDEMPYSPGENPPTDLIYPGPYGLMSDTSPHGSEAMGSDMFPCTECGKCFAREMDLEDHQKTHKNINECLTQNGGVLSHLMVHKALKPFSCSQCGKGFTRKSYLIHHQRIHMGVKPFPCSECGKSFTQKSVLVQHQRSHTGEKPFFCSECGKCFSIKSSLVEHRKIHTGEKPFLCFDCGKCFYKKSDLVKHQRFHTGEKPYSCSECGRSFANKSNLTAHKRSHTGEKPFPCLECGKCFTKKSILVKHQIAHTEGRQFSCSECGSQFTQKVDFLKHRRSHKRVKLTCTECGKCFDRKSLLVQHQRIHTGDKPFSCSECGKRFLQKADFVDHQRTHTGEKPFSCLECGRCYTKKSSLVQHRKVHSAQNLIDGQRIHTGRKPFSCSECGKCYSNKSSLVQHQKIHSADMPFSCSECGNCFTQKSYLIRHQRSHTGERPFTCSDCGKGFTQKAGLIAHLKVHTGETSFTPSDFSNSFPPNSDQDDPQKILIEEKPFFGQSQPLLKSKDWNSLTARILNLTMEMICLLTGEGYTVVKTSDKCVTPSSCPRVPGGWSMTQSPIMEPPPPSLITERNMGQKILELTHKILELLSGEVPIRCQDVSVYFSLEEWDYIEEHKDQYKDVIMEALAEPDGSSDGNPAEGARSPVSSQSHPEEKRNLPHDYQARDPMKAEVFDRDGSYEGADLQCKEEEAPTNLHPEDDDRKTSGEPYDIAKDCLEQPAIQGTCLGLTDLTWAPSSHEEHSEHLVSQNHEGQETSSLKGLFCCSQCEKGFTRKSSLLKHEIIHTGEKLFSCSECGKCFMFKDHLQRHQRIHTGEKPYQCSECGRRFIQKSGLSKHQKVHTGEKPYSCSECGKCFAEKSGLVRHQRTHTGEKPYSCSECDKCFAQKLELVEHHRNHTGEKPFLCLECGQCFSRTSVLANHQRIHKGKIPQSKHKEVSI